MLFRKKKAKEIEQAILANKDQSYWANVRRQFRKNRLAVWSLRVFWGLLFVAIFADFIANERPLLAKLDGEIICPIVKNYGVKLGVSQWDEKFVVNRWNEHDYDWAFFPPIPYSATTQDKYNRNYKGPFDEQRIKATPEWRHWHWLGTDNLGRDVSAGMVHGTRVAVFVGVVAMFIASIIGIFIGALAGYFGDDRLQVSRIRIILCIIGFFLAIFYAVISRRNAYAVAAEDGGMAFQILLSIAIFIGVMVLANLLASALKPIKWLGHKTTVALDILVMRFIEVFNSIPGLLLILSIVAITKPSIVNVMIIIGLISWTGIARFIRAELLKVRSLEYIEAAQAMGFSERRIIMRHAIPNALTPVLIAIAFGVASAILTEAFLSFLGIGLAAEDVTWGSLLNLARKQFSAWWLAVFPGFAIFITITIFNLLGEGLTDALDPRLKQ